MDFKRDLRFLHNYFKILIANIFQWRLILEFVLKNIFQNSVID